MIPLDKVRKIIDTYETLEKELASSDIEKNDFVKKSKEYSSIGEIIHEAKGYIGFEKEKKELEKIILCDVQKKIQPNLEKTFTNLLNNSGFNEININKIDFDKLYNERFN